MTPTHTEGTAKHPVYNTSALLWVGLIGIPGALFLMLLFKLHLI
ncbi:MAG: hypothetical protein QE263_00905 [Vampirovibrionales bacterium]|nr:hypothetical protein [Vampirovibrionales bacterium]